VCTIRAVFAELSTKSPPRPASSYCWHDVCLSSWWIATWEEKRVVWLLSDIWGTNSCRKATQKKIFFSSACAATTAELNVQKR
jgi:hypothetical protein